MKRLALTLLLLFTMVELTFSQVGMYHCIHYEFKNGKDNLKDVTEVDTKLLQVDFETEIGPYVLFMLDSDANDPAEITVKWNIQSRLSTVQEANPFRITTTYTALREVNGVEQDGLLYIYKTEDRNLHTLTIVVHSPVADTKECFIDMIKR